MKIIKTLFILFLALIPHTIVLAQNAPVSTTTTVLPPFSVHMFENLRSDRDKFIVTVTLRDLTQTEGQVRLRLRMESFTHAMQTRRGAATPVHTLIPGVPLRLTNEDLRVYFLEQNLEFTNMPRNLYRNNATVPEGHYRIWFEVYEARTGAHVSRGSEVAAHLHIVQHDVPLINLPQPNATIHLPESGLQHVVFQWAPRHFGPGMLTEYRLQIVEVPPGMNPEQVMHATLVPFFETTTMATSFVFNHTHPPMRLGFTYAFRVQARLRGPDEGMSMFNNNGFTPTQWFTFSQRCPELRNVRVEPINQFAVWVHYMDHPLYERVRIRRRLDQEGSFWHYVAGDQNPLLVTELRPEQGYQYQMMAYCAFEHSNWTPVRTFTTPPAPPPAFTCGMETEPMVVENQNPLQDLRRGDRVRVGRDGWEFRVTEVTRSLGNGVFYGYGSRRTPWLGDVWIRMRFENVQFNELYQVMAHQGFFVTVFDPNEGNILNLDALLDREEPPPTDDITTIEVPIIIADNAEITIADSEGNPITEDSQPPFTITITNPDGEEEQITVEYLPAVIVDGSGAEYIVNRDGTIERKVNNEADQAPKISIDGIDIEKEIIKALLDLRNIEATFDKIEEKIDREIERLYFEPIFIKGINNEFVGRGMSRLLSENEGAEETGEVLLYDLILRLYRLDVVRLMFERNPEQLVGRVNRVLTQNENQEYMVDADFKNSVALIVSQVQEATEVVYRSIIRRVTFEKISENE